MKYKNLKYTYNVVGFALIVFLALRESLSVVLLRTPLDIETPLFVILSIVIYILACFVPVVMLENMLGIHPLLFKKVKAADAAATAGFGYLIILAAGIANSIILMLLEKAGLQFAPNNPTIPEEFSAALMYFLYICVLPPLLEEIFVRGLVLNVFRGWGVPFAVFVSSVIFALMHSSLHSFVLYFVCGVVLAKIYIAFDSIWPCVLLHFVNNTVSFVQLSFGQSANAQSAVFFSIYIYLMAMLLGYAGFKHIQKRKINLAFSFTRMRDIKYKISSLANSYAALCALALLLFMAAYNSFHLLV
ncbi:MAG: CPBP family intramembrane metalloprotease [Oscillospiraceae bacterium]|nr:CPBP family intramembrane metalloprotease [Oscillospiraceae bacterium]